jgi:integrase
MRIRMDLRLVKRPRSPFWYIRGIWRGRRIFESTGTADDGLAQRVLEKREEELFSGGEKRGHTFAGAIISYRQAGGDRRFLAPLLEYFKDRPLKEIDQAAIDEAAHYLYPEATPATRNRQVYTVMSAILRHAGIKLDLRRPKGARGNARTAWLAPEEAFALLSAAEALQPRFGALCTFLLYTGCRLSEGLRLKWADVDLQASLAHVRMTKNGEPRTVYLPEVVVAALANINPKEPLEAATRGDGGKFAPVRVRNGPGNGTVFGFVKDQALMKRFHFACSDAGLNIPAGTAFHILRHTYGAWMRRYAGLDTAGLVGTGAWKSRQAAAVYEHVDAQAEAKKVVLLPVRRRG